MKKVLLFVVVALVWTAQPAVSEAPPAVLVRTTKQLASGVAVGKSVATAPRSLVATIPVSLAAGDVVEVSYRVQATNDVGYNVAFDCFVTRSGNNFLTGERAIDDYGDRRVIRPLGRNITPDMHHDHRYMGDTEVIGSDYVGHYNLICYAANKTWPKPGDTLTLDPGDAMLSAVIHR